MSNQDQKISGGLLARVKFSNNENPPILIPESALKIGNPREKKLSNTVFILDNVNGNKQVTVKQITMGENKNGKVEVFAGLNPGDRLIVRSTGKLENGQRVRLSAISTNE